jgi:hypothetical protein
VLPPHVILQLVLEVTLVVAVSAEEALLLAAAVDLVALECLRVLELLATPGAPVQVLALEAAMLAADVLLEGGLVPADEGAGRTLELGLLPAGQPLVAAQILVAREPRRALAAGHSAVLARPLRRRVLVAADGLYVAVQGDVLAEHLPALGALQQQRRVAALAIIHSFASWFTHRLPALWAVQQNQLGWTW